MSWCDDDPELLRAAFEIIDTWDEDSAGTSISVHSPLADASGSAGDVHDGQIIGADVSATTVLNGIDTSGSVEVTVPLAPSRNRRREEIIYLRDKVKEMESQLAQLEKSKQDVEGPGSHATSADMELAVMWQDIAHRQKRLRHKSELDQAKLRKLLETQLKVADGLMKLMQKARRLEDDEAFPQTKRMRLTGGPGARLDEGAQIARLHTHYENLDVVFSFPKFRDGSRKFVDIEVTDELEEEVVIEHREAWTVPFETNCVLDALWQYTLQRNEEKWCEPGYEASTTTRQDGTELVSRFAAKSTVCGFSGHFNGQTVVKRFAGGPGKPPAIIMITDTEPEPTTRRDIDGFFVDDYMFLRVLPGSGPASGGIPPKPVTIVQCMQRFEIRFEEKAQHARHRAGVLTNMILDKLQDDAELKHSTVETLLLRSR